ncbi:MAG: hypothetical protein GX556_13835 [Fibrobacter sp.]|nr:hypothetical protein [Fibrobacter sp.]
MTKTDNSGKSTCFPISFEFWYRILSFVVGLPPSGAYVNLSEERIEVRMGWAFRSSFPRSAVKSASALNKKPLSRGVHGFCGRWLVNGSGKGILSIKLDPVQRARVLGFPVRLRELLVSVEDISVLAEILQSTNR